MVGIYSITNKENGNRYIGQSVHLETREAEHFYSLSCGNHFNQHLQSAYNKYGKDSFYFEVLEECDVDDLSDKEVKWILHYGGCDSACLYNVLPGGKSNCGKNNPNFGKHWSEDFKQAQSARMKEYFSDKENHPMYGKHHSDKTKSQISESLTGRAQPEETNDKRSKTLKKMYALGVYKPSFEGRHHSEETKRKLRESSSKYKHSEESKEKIRKAVSGSNNGMYGKHHSDEVRKKMSDQRKGPGNNMYGKVRITDGTINTVWPKDEPIPEGFRLGMKPRTKK